MSKLQIASMAYIYDDTGGQEIAGSGTTEISLDTELVNTETDFIGVDLANNALVLKKVGWYLCWGGVHVYYGGTQIGFVAFGAQLHLDDTHVAYASGDFGRITFDAANNHLQRQNTSSLSPMPIFNDTADNHLNLKSARIDHFGLTAVNTATGAASQPGKSYLAAAWLRDSV